MTPTDLALAVDRLAHRAKPAAVFGTDYSFGPEPRPAPVPPTAEERTALAKLTPADREKAMQARVAALPKPVFGITKWDVTQLGPQPTQAQIETEAAAPSATVRVLSKLDIRRQLREWNKEDAFDKMLDAFPHARTDWDDAAEIKTSDPLFSANKEAFQAALSLSDEQFTALMQLK